MKLDVKKILYVIYHILRYDIRALMRIAINPTETWYRAWKITPNNGNIAGIDVFGFTRQAIMFDGTEQIDAIPYPHKTVKGNCLVEVYSNDTRPYYFGNGTVYIRNARLSGKVCSLYIEAKYNDFRERHFIDKAVGEMLPEYKGMKFRTTRRSKKAPILYEEGRSS